MKKKMTPVLVLLLASCSGTHRIGVLPRPPDYVSTMGMMEQGSGVDAFLAREAWTLNDLLQWGDLNNPGLQAAKKEVEFAETRVWEAGLYPNPTLRYEYDDGPVTGPEHTAALTLPLVYSGRRGVAEDSARRIGEVSASRWEGRRLLLRSRIKRAFAQVLHLEERLKLSRELGKVAKEFHELTEVRFSAGDIAEMEVLKTRVSLLRLDLESGRMEKSVEVAYRELFQLVGRVDLPRGKLIGSLDSSPPELDLETLRARALAKNHRLRRAKMERKSEVAKLDLVRAERWPDLGITLGFGRDTVEGGIEIPLPLFNRNQAKIAGAGIRIRQADFRIGQVRNEILAELSRIFADYTAAREAALQYEKEILPSVIMAYRQTREGYTNRKFSYLDVLDAQGTLVETRSAHLVALRDLAWAAADLERLTGGKTTSR